MKHNMQEHILKHFDAEQSGHVMTILARVLAVETLIVGLWTHTLSQFEDPLREAELLREEFMSLPLFDEDDVVQVQAVEELEQRLDAIVERVKTL